MNSMDKLKQLRARHTERTIVSAAKKESNNRNNQKNNNYTYNTWYNEMRAVHALYTHMTAVICNKIPNLECLANNLNNNQP